MKGFPPHTVTLGLIKSTSRSSATGFIGHTTIKPREINVNTNGDSIIIEHHLASEYDQFPVGIAGGIKHLMRKSMERCQALTGNTNKNSLNPKISEILNDTILNKYPTQSENAWAFVYANKELFGKNVDSYYLFRARSTRDADEKRVDFLVFGFDESKLEYFFKTAMVPRENQLNKFLGDSELLHNQPIGDKNLFDLLKNNGQKALASSKMDLNLSSTVCETPSHDDTTREGASQSPLEPNTRENKLSLQDEILTRFKKLTREFEILSRIIAVSRKNDNSKYSDEIHITSTFLYNEKVVQFINHVEQRVDEYGDFITNAMNQDPHLEKNQDICAVIEFSGVMANDLSLLLLQNIRTALDMYKNIVLVAISTLDLQQKSYFDQNAIHNQEIPSTSATPIEEGSCAQQATAKLQEHLEEAGSRYNRDESVDTQPPTTTEELLNTLSNNPVSYLRLAETMQNKLGEFFSETTSLTMAEIQNKSNEVLDLARQYYEKNKSVSLLKKELEKANQKKIRKNIADINLLSSQVREKVNLCNKICGKARSKEHLMRSLDAPRIGGLSGVESQITLLNQFLDNVINQQLTLRSDISKSERKLEQFEEDLSSLNIRKKGLASSKRKKPKKRSKPTQEQQALRQYIQKLKNSIQEEKRKVSEIERSETLCTDAIKNINFINEKFPIVRDRINNFVETPPMRLQSL